ncbi:MAG: hypothetical protein JJE09_14845 [Bacteroidia bacterium]|nr:hypothetical protein [Bacteroidia bacterium]
MKYAELPMIFTSIKGYFYKLYNVCYILVLVPLALFLFLYYQAQVEKILPIIQDPDVLVMLEGGLFLVALAGLATVHLYLRKEFVKVSKEVALGDKMDRYFPLALVRTSLGSSSAFFMNIGFFLTGSLWLAIAFGFIMIWIWWQWPTPKRFCNDLSVRNDERELLLKSKYSF